MLKKIARQPSFCTIQRLVCVKALCSDLDDYSLSPSLIHIRNGKWGYHLPAPLVARQFLLFILCFAYSVMVPKSGRRENSIVKPNCYCFMI